MVGRSRGFCGFCGPDVLPVQADHPSLSVTKGEAAVPHRAVLVLGVETIRPGRKRYGDRARIAVVRRAGSEVLGKPAFVGTVDPDIDVGTVVVGPEGDTGSRAGAVSRTISARATV